MSNTRTQTITGIIVLVLLVVSTLGIIYFYYFHGKASAGIKQPISFSHRLHVTEKEIDCRFCHTGVMDSPKAGLPEVGKCLYCHNHIIRDHPEIRKIHRAFDSGKSIVWKRVNRLPDFVYFSHRRHINKKIECVECHGKVEKMDRVITVNEFLMGFCVSCHNSKKAPVDCLTCHK